MGTMPGESGGLLNLPGTGRTLLQTTDGINALPEIAQAGERFLGRRVTCISVPRGVMRAIAGIDSWLARVAGRAATVTPEKVNELYHDDWVCRENRVADFAGWRPRVDLDEGMRLTLGWYMKKGWL